MWTSARSAESRAPTWTTIARTSSIDIGRSLRARELRRPALCVRRACKEVASCERPPGPGLQVLLETCGLRFGRKLDNDDQRPRSEAHGVSAGPVVVPFQASGDVARDANVVVFMVGVAAEDVDEALADAVHGIRLCMRRAIGPCYFAERIEGRDREYAVSACGGSRRVQIPAVVRLRSGLRWSQGPPARTSARQPSRVRVFAVRWRERVQIAVGGPPSLGPSVVTGLRPELRRDSLRLSECSRELGGKGTDGDLPA